MRILIVDDDATFRAIVKSKMANAGHAVIEACDGESGWDMMQTAAIDFAFVDLGLPDMDGRELITLARGSARTNRLPILVITGRDDREAIDDAFGMGANYFLTKPINWPLFRHQISYLTRMIETERKIHLAHVATQAENRLKDTIIGRLNCVLRPMAADIATASREFVTLVDNGAGVEQLRGIADHIQLDARTLEKTLGVIANFARLLNGNVDICETPISVGHMLADIARSVERDWSTRTLHLEVPEKKIWLHCDRNQLSLALLSLLDNSYRFAPTNSPVRLSMRQLADGSLCFVVDDEGPGIPPPQLRRLLAPMAVLEQMDRDTGNIDGLGLAAVKFITEAHGGKLGVQSAVGRGTTATIHLPAELVITKQISADAA